MPNTTGI